MEPVSLELGLDLSPPVAASLDGLVDAVVKELRSWGVAVEHARIPRHEEPVEALN